MTKLCFPEQVLDQHLVVLGKTGAGKSSALRHIVEHLLSRKKRVCVIDIKGDWWGLKSSADGKSAGFPVIAFGSFREPKATDVPINSRSGKHIAELITSGNRPCIIGFRGWMIGDITDFWLDFAQALFNTNEGELYVVISECHNFAPKGKVLDPKAGRVLHWTNRLLSEGRGLGMTFLLDSQRPQKVHNDTLTCCETLVAMRVIHAADRQALKDWIDGCGDKSTGAELLNNVAQLARGEAYVWSPEIDFGPKRMRFPMFETFDSFAPAQLQRKVSQDGWSTVDLEAVKTKLATVIEEAKRNDPSELRKEIIELKKQLAQKPPVHVLDDMRVSALEAQNRSLRDQINSFSLGIRPLVDSMFPNAASAVSSAVDRLREVVGRLTIAEMPVVIERTMPRNQMKLQSRTSEVVIKNVAAPVSNGDGTLSGPEQRIVNAIAWFESIGIRQPLQTAVAFLAKYTVGGGAFNNPRGSLRMKGCIEYAGECLALTDAGRALAEQPTTPLTADELQSRVMGLLPMPEQKILKVLLGAYPQSVANDELARLSSYEPGGGAFNNPRGRLKTLGLIGYPRKGEVRAQDLLFLN